MTTWYNRTQMFENGHFSKFLFKKIPVIIKELKIISKFHILCRKRFKLMLLQLLNCPSYFSEKLYNLKDKNRRNGQNLLCFIQMKLKLMDWHSFRFATSFVWWNIFSKENITQSQDFSKKKLRSYFKTNNFIKVS